LILSYHELSVGDFDSVDFDLSVDDFCSFWRTQCSQMSMLEGNQLYRMLRYRKYVNKLTESLDPY
jgi:hypothetical protein